MPVPVRMARRAAFLQKALDRYDVFHFNYGQTLMQVRQLGRVVDELPLLRREGKKILVTFQGCDLRPALGLLLPKAGCVQTDPYRQPAAERALRYADRVFYLNPDLGRWLPGGQFFPYANVDPRGIEPAVARRSRRAGGRPRPDRPRRSREVDYVVEAVDRFAPRDCPCGSISWRALRTIRCEERTALGGHRRRSADDRLVRRVRGRGHGFGQAGRVLHP